MAKLRTRAQGGDAAAGKERPHAEPGAAAPSPAARARVNAQRRARGEQPTPTRQPGQPDQKTMRAGQNDQPRDPHVRAQRRARGEQTGSSQGTRAAGDQSPSSRAANRSGERTRTEGGAAQSSGTPRVEAQRRARGDQAGSAQQGTGGARERARPGATNQAQGASEVRAQRHTRAEQGDSPQGERQSGGPARTARGPDRPRSSRVQNQDAPRAEQQGSPQGRAQRGQRMDRPGRTGGQGEPFSGGQPDREAQRPMEWFGQLTIAAQNWIQEAGIQAHALDDFANRLLQPTIQYLGQHPEVTRVTVVADVIATRLPENPDGIAYRYLGPRVVFDPGPAATIGPDPGGERPIPNLRPHLDMLVSVPVRTYDVSALVLGRPLESR